MKKAARIILPASTAVVNKLKTGDQVLLSGSIYVARDAAHRRINEALAKRQPLPFSVNGQAIYYMGPAPAGPGHIIGSAGPTTSGRMDVYTPRLLEEGLKVMIGKGERSVTVKKAIKKYGAVYLAATGGAGALLAKRVKKCEIVAYPELGPEAVLRLEIKNFPAVVVNDTYGGDLYTEEQARHRRPFR